MAKKHLQNTEATSPTPEQELATIRARLLEVAAERRSVEAAPPPLAVVQARARELVASEASRWKPNMAPIMGARADPASFRLFGFPVGVRDRDDLESRMQAYECAVRGAAALDALLAYVAATWPDVESLSDEERRERLEALDLERETLEFAEEATVRRAAQLGIELARRPDANPAVFLGDIDDLPDAAA